MVTTVTHASAQFVAYGLLSKYVLEDQILLLTLRAAQPHLNAEELGSVIFAMPSTRYEQERIAAYLNASCAAIDAAVSAKRRQLKTLDALKRSAIFHAVTRGLDDSDSLKASGIDWLGEIPAHWTIRRIKDIAELRSGDAIQSEDIAPEGDYPVYGGNGLRGFTSSYTHNGQFALIGRQGALCGNINYADGMFWATEHAVVATLLRRYDTLWFGELLRAMNLGQYSNAAAQPGLAVDRIKFLRLPVPPPEEQTRIAEHVRTIIQQNESIGTAIQSQITTLNAYRNSLIHECVTGQRRITEADLVRVGRGKSTLTRSSR
jgi:type I restriction enzyme S subunit